MGATVLTIPPMQVKGLRTESKHGYKAVQVEIKDGKLTRVREIRTEDEPEVGSEIKFDEIVAAGDRITIAGITKGKGFAGAVKRHGFKGGPRTHGQSDRERAPGSSGSTTTPGRVYKGKRRAGHMGNERVTIQNLRVLDVNAEKRLITVKGSVPGAARFRLLEIKKV